MLHGRITRRYFVSSLSGAAAWPLAARAQQTDRKRRVGVLMNFAADDAEGQPRLTALVQGLQELGWTDGRNLQSREFAHSAGRTSVTSYLRNGRETGHPREETSHCCAALRLSR